MATIKDLREKLIAYLDSVDYSKMTMWELNGYVSILKSLDEMEKPSPFDAISKAAFPLPGNSPMPVEGGKNG